ncbi:Protein CBR-GLD-3 [Caenorhabditis briggsae]|uniref:Protein CBR-GLD-3 n=1 Tax=Caenorhabditis briggsae TaxID=6238 RepID=A8XH08_CAEBR|nr:Protein CBR-GLD-3 [Caenorhabditis briggsae]CAP31932.2 Protein CBR-GLD-3 [Caenorhabditis briggsae]
MGEQSKESEPDEASSYHPFVRSEVEYDAATRLQMAEEIASTRRMFVSPILKDIIVNPENFYQECQQSAKVKKVTLKFANCIIQMAEDANQRRQMSFNTKREAYIHQMRAKGIPLPSKIPMIEINPTRVTLSLEFESQYYSLMTNDYGDHENVASIMQKTNTLIQLPDHTVGGAAPDPFTQQVTITGHYSDVDRARKLMRENCHLSVIMSLNEMKISPPELQDFVGQNPIQNVEMSLINYAVEKKGRVRPYLRFTSRAKNEQDLVSAANKIIQKAFGKELPRQHPLIEQRTNVIITYPHYNTKDDIRENLLVVKIDGTVENVLQARKCLMDLLPVSMCFNMKNTDMAAQSKLADRCVHVVIEESRTMLKMTPSVYEPSELLSEEVPLHCASLRSKEFNIKHMYTAYQKVLSLHLASVASTIILFLPCAMSRRIIGFYTQPSTSQKLIWGFFSFETHAERKSGPEGSSAPMRSSARVSSVSECIGTDDGYTSTELTFHFQHNPSWQCRRFQIPSPATDDAAATCVHERITGDSSDSHSIVHDRPNYRIVNECASHMPLQSLSRLSHSTFFNFRACLSVKFPADQTGNRPDHQSTSSQQNHMNRKPGRIMNRPASAASTYNHTSSTQRPRRMYEQLRDDDARSTRSGSRRTSICGDEPTVGSFEDRGWDRQLPRHQQRFSKDENMRWKTGSRGDVHGKRNTYPQKDPRGQGPTRDHDFVSAGSSERPQSNQSDQNQLQTIHHLKLKPNDIDLDHERLFTHDSPHLEDAPDKNGFANELMDGDFVQRLLSNVNLSDQKKRSRAISCVLDRDEQSARQTDSDCAYSLTDQGSSHPSRSIDSFKKMAGIGVTKTLLEPRTRADKEYGKICLEHKEKYSGEGKDEDNYLEMRPSLGSRQYRIDPMKLIASVRESSEQLPRIHERQFNDVLNDKGREMKQRPQWIMHSAANNHQKPYNKFVEMY